MTQTPWELIIFCGDSASIWTKIATRTCPCSSLYWVHKRGELIILLTLYFSTKQRNMIRWALDGEWLMLLSFFILILLRAQKESKIHSCCELSFAPFQLSVTCLVPYSVCSKMNWDLPFCHMDMSQVIFWQGRRRIKPSSKVNVLLELQAFQLPHLGKLLPCVPIVLFMTPYTWWLKSTQLLH